MRSFWVVYVMMFGFAGAFAQPSPPLGQDGCFPRGGARPVSNKGAIGSSPLSPYVQTLDLPVRYQFDHNAGYCGETSLIASGLYYGQYVSQWAVRQLCDPSDPNVQTDNQVLLGVNADAVADALHLDHVAWNAIDTTGFLKWIKAYVLNGYPTIIGVFLNECIFYDSSCNSAADGDQTYDHIVPVFGIGSNSALTPPSLPPVLNDIPFYNSDILILSDNGLYGSGSDSFPGTPPYPGIRYVWALPFGPEVPTGQMPNSLSSFQASRKQANGSSAHAYSVPSSTYCNENSIATYGLAILGPKDSGGDTIPVRIHIEPVNTSLNYTNSFVSVDFTQDAFFYEWPVIAHGQTAAPLPNLGTNGSTYITLTVSVTIPDQSQTYYLYYYDDLSMVPNSNFNANAANAASRTVIQPNSGDTYVLTPKPSILSNQVAVFRAVSMTAP